MPTPKVIDISHYQTIPEDLMATAASGILGVIHKCTEGGSYVDDKCQARHYLTQQAGMRFGIYHFLKNGDQVDHARHFIDTAHTLGVLDENTLLAADHEADVSFDSLMVFLEEIEEMTGRVPVIYSGHTIKDQCSSSNPYPNKYRLWLAHYNDEPTLPVGCEKFYLHQYTDKGHVDGINGYVDLNQIQEGITDAEFLAMWSGGPETVPPVLPEPEPSSRLRSSTSMSSPLRMSKSRSQWTMLRRWLDEFFRERRIIGSAVVAGFLVTIGVYLFLPPKESEVLSVLIGALAAAFAMICGHYFSEPRGHKLKETMDEIRKEEEEDK